ncbi:Alkane hydroxylase MAH1 [Linum perenne]
MTSLRGKLQTGLFPLLDRAARAPRTMELDMQDVYKRFMFDSICTMVFGLDPKYLTADLLPDILYAQAYEILEEAAFYRYITPNFYWKFQRLIGIGEERKFRQAREKFDEFLYGTIKLKRESFQKTQSRNSEEEEKYQFDFSWQEHQRKKSDGLASLTTSS